MKNPSQVILEDFDELYGWMPLLEMAFIAQGRQFKSILPPREMFLCMLKTPAAERQAVGEALLSYIPEGAPAREALKRFGSW